MNIFTDYKKRLEGLTKELQDNQSMVEQLKQDSDQLTTQLTEAKQLVEKYSKEIEQLRSENHKEDLQTLTKKTEELTNKNKELLTENESISKELKSLKEKYSDFDEQVSFRLMEELSKLGSAPVKVIPFNNSLPKDRSQKIEYFKKQFRK